MKKTTRRAVAAVILPVLALTACGSDSDDPEDPAPGVETPDETEAPAETEPEAEE